MAGCWPESDYATSGGYDYPLHRSGQVMADMARPTGTETSDDQAVVTENSKGKGKGPGKGRGKGKWTPKSRGKGKRSSNPTGTAHRYVTPLPSKPSEVDDNNSVVTDVGADEISVVTEESDAEINEWRQHIDTLTKKRDMCADELESARKDLVDAITVHKQTKVLLVQAFALLDCQIKETEEVNRLRNIAIDEAIASNDSRLIMGLCKVDDTKRTRITGKQSQFVPPPPGLSSPNYILRASI